MKTCFRCGVSKPLEDFYKHPMMADGHLGKCKECAKEDVRMHRILHPDIVRETDRRKYAKTERGQRAKRLKQLRATVDWRMRRKANTMVGNAVRDKKLFPKSACEKCGSTLHIEGHHEDYSKPLDVIWLCRKCHYARHSELTRLGIVLP